MLPRLAVLSVERTDAGDKQFRECTKRNTMASLRPKSAASKLVKGVAETPGGTVRPRTPGSADEGLYIDKTDFATLKSIVGDPKRKGTAEDRQRIAAALQMIRDELANAKATVARQNPDASQTDIVDEVVGPILAAAQESSPEQAAILLATLSNQVDTLPIESQQQEQQVEEMNEAIERTRSQVKLRIERVKDLSAKQKGNLRTQLQPRTLPFGGKPEISTAAAQVVNETPPGTPGAVDQPPPVSPRPVAATAATEDQTPRQSVLLRGIQAGVSVGRNMLGWADTQDEDV